MEHFSSYILIPVIYSKFNSLFYCYLCGSILSIISLTFIIFLFYLNKKYFPRNFFNSSNKFCFSAIKSFTIFYWIVLIYIVLIDSFNSFLTGNLNDLFFNLFGFSNTYSGYLSSLNNIIQLFTPVIAILTKKYGKALYQIIISHICLTMSVFFLIYPEYYSNLLYVWIPNAIFSISITFIYIHTKTYLVMVVDEKFSGTALGIVLAIDDGFVATMGVIDGIIQDKTINYKHGYFWSVNYVIILLNIGLFFLIYLDLLNYKRKWYLNK